MAEDWTAVAAEVAEALGDFQEVTLHQPGSGGTYDPATDTTSGASEPQDHIGSGIEDKFSAFSIASGVVEASDIKLLLSPLKLDGTPMPQPVADSWTVTFGGKERTIKRVERIAPAGTTVLYEITVRA